jgi:hypothetical protein
MFFVTASNVNAGQWFSTGTTVSSTNKTDHHDLTEILLKVVLTNITLPLTPRPTHTFPKI